jgi:GMP synthase-like glutamine amidotransferase
MQKLLLIQVRPPESTVAEDEAGCFLRHFEPGTVHLDRRCALRERAEPSWLDGYHGLLIGGSGNLSLLDHQDKPWVSALRRVIEKALHDNVPTLAICFGHQLTGFHLGSRVIHDTERGEFGTTNFSLSRDGHDDDVFGPLGTPFAAHTGHTDHVMDAPAGTQLLASSAKVEVQGFRVEGAPYYTAQFHPDLTADDAISRIHSLADFIGGEEGDYYREKTRLFQPAGDKTARLLDRFSRLTAAEAERRGNVIIAHA